MRHQQILDRLTATGHVRALDQELTRWVRWNMLGRPKTRREMEEAVIPSILGRWRCLLDAKDARTATKSQVWIALATLLHKYGLRDDTATATALAAVDQLNDDVVLDDLFARQSSAIKTFLQSTPLPLTRRPRQPPKITFLRPGDVICIESSRRFHAAFVREIRGANEFPIIEFYAGRFAQRPTMQQLSGRQAAQDRGHARFGVVGLTSFRTPQTR